MLTSARLSPHCSSALSALCIHLESGIMLLVGEKKAGALNSGVALGAFWLVNLLFRLQCSPLQANPVLTKSRYNEQIIVSRYLVCTWILSRYSEKRMKQSYFHFTVCLLRQSGLYYECSKPLEQ